MVAWFIQPEANDAKQGNKSILQRYLLSGTPLEKEKFIGAFLFHPGLNLMSPILASCHSLHLHIHMFTSIVRRGIGKSYCWHVCFRKQYAVCCMKKICEGKMKYSTTMTLKCLDSNYDKTYFFPLQLQFNRFLHTFVRQPWFCMCREWGTRNADMYQWVYPSLEEWKQRMYTYLWRIYQSIEKIK